MDFSLIKILIVAFLASSCSGVQQEAPAVKSKVLTEEPARDGLDQGEEQTGDWVLIQGGQFMMGSDQGEEDERPVHSVNVPSFYMMRSEVTLGQYIECIDSRKCSEPRDNSAYPSCNWGYGDRLKHPVNCVSWDQAMVFCEFFGGRLPTEAEWEYAARSGGKDQQYPWGDAIPSCEYTVMDPGKKSGCGAKHTREVCSIPKGNTEQGLCDMIGNVWEWVADRKHENYEGAPEDGSAWTDGSDERRILRGGSWYDERPTYLRATYRDGDVPSFKDTYNGFRCARDAK